MVKNKNSWSALSMKEKADVINICAKGGLLNLKDIKEFYNSFGNGGRILSGEEEEESTLSGLPYREMTASQAARENAMLNKAAYMLAVGDSLENPEYLYPGELMSSSVVADGSEYRAKQAQEEAIKFRDRSLKGHIGADLGLNLGDTSLQDIATVGIASPLLATNPVTSTIVSEAIAPATKHTLGVMMNPASANTTAGALLATGADALGATAGIMGNSRLLGKWWNGQFNWSDIPEFLLNSMDFIPAMQAMNNSIQYLNNARKTSRYYRGIEDTFTTQTPDETVVYPTDNTADIDAVDLLRAQEGGNHDLLDNTIPRDVDVDGPTTTTNTITTPQTPEVFRAISDSGDSYSREEIESLLRSSGANEDIINAALQEFDYAESMDNPHEFFDTLFSITNYNDILARARTGDFNNYLIAEDGTAISVDEARNIYRRQGFNEGAAEHRINEALSQNQRISHYDLPSILEDVNMDLSGYTDDDIIQTYNSILAKRSYLEESMTHKGGYKHHKEDLKDYEIENFRKIADRVKQALGKDIDFSDLSEDNFIKIKQTLLEKGFTPGDIEHMFWFQMADSMPRDRQGKILITEADGTTRPIMFGERPPDSIKGSIKAARQAKAMYDEIPRGFSVAETNTSFDSENLKLRGALSNYGTNPGQFTVEPIPGKEWGNVAHHERLYLRDYLKYKDSLPQEEQQLLDALLARDYASVDPSIYFPNTQLYQIMKKDMTELGHSLAGKLAEHWKKIKATDTRDIIQNAELPSFNEAHVDQLIRTLIREGRAAPPIKRTPIAVFKHAEGGPLNNATEEIDFTKPFAGALGMGFTNTLMQEYDQPAIPFEYADKIVPEEPTKTTPTVYTVKPGDSLSRISKNIGVSIE